LFAGKRIKLEMTEEEILHNMKSIDKDGDGLITFEELTPSLSEPDLDEETKAEMAKAMEPLRAIFPKADSSGDGKLDVKEMATLLKLYREEMEQQRDL